MSGFVKCGECNGRGRKEYNPATGPTKCMKCKGAGQIKCPTCRGEGFR
jgi:DnaJ-class molecular chaperone